MTELLELQPGDRVLEIGTGSGYQAAVLAQLGYGEVYSVDVIPELAAQAAERLRALGYDAIHLRCGDGYHGWPEFAPYNGIVVTAAVAALPPPLGEQLAEGGRLVIPLGEPRGRQVLWQYAKHGGRLAGREIVAVAFVPFTRSREAGLEAKDGRR
jgi:protein-L-isoaspartate(D-aspartate) O-methyltransferase